MNPVLLCTLITLVLGPAQHVHAQRHGRFRYETYVVPQAPVVQAAAAPAPPAPQVSPSAPIPQITPVPEKASTNGVSCCDGDGKCTPECNKGKNPPVVTSTCPPGKEECKDIPVEIVPGDIEVVITDEKFYAKCTNYEAKVPVPTFEITSVEKCYFKKYTYKVKADDCCEITVCVPCKSCTTKTTRCVTKISDKAYKISICQRRDGTVDVYVYDVPGMPQKWLLYLEANEQTVKKELGLP